MTLGWKGGCSLTNEQKDTRDFLLRLTGLLAAEFLVLDFLPGFHGPYEIALGLAAAHKDLAPWFSGTATSVGVLVALFNAQMKERSDDRRLELATTRAARATAEAACSLANAIHMNLVVITNVLREDDWAEGVDALTDIIIPSLGISRDAMRRFPMHNLPMKSIESWYRVELFQHHVTDDLEKLRDIRSQDPNDYNLLVRKRAVLKSVNTLEGMLRHLVRALKVDVTWDYGSIKPFDVSKTLKTEIDRTTEIIDSIE